MIDPYHFISYFGFTASEVKALCDRFEINIEEARNWYNGYFVELNQPIYNPTSVTNYLRRQKIGNYWNRTETYEALKDYIVFDFDGLQNKFARLIAGEQLNINPDKFSNDMSTFNSTDDVLTLLVHLGYLSYCWEKRKVRIPNEEVKREFINSIEDLDSWDTVVKAINDSRSLTI